MISEAGSFSCLRVRFKLKRKFSTAFASYMAPVSLFVFVAYLTFWIPSCVAGPVSTSQMSNQMANQMASLFSGHLIQVRVLLLVYSLSALYWKASVNESSVGLPANPQSTNRTASITVWHFVNLTFVLIAFVEYIAQLNQSSVRNFFLRKLLQDAANLDQSSGQNYGTVGENNNRNATLTLHPKHSTKVHLNGANNHNHSSNLPINNQEPPAEANRSMDADKRNDAPSRNRIYLKMLGLRPPLNGRHQSSGQIAGEQELASKDYDGSARHVEGMYSPDWLDRLFRVFYPIFYVAFLFLFLFITLIS